MKNRQFKAISQKSFNKSRGRAMNQTEPERVQLHFSKTRKDYRLRKNNQREPGRIIYKVFFEGRIIYKVEINAN